MEQHHLVMVKGISHASVDLQDARVAERQAQGARHVLRGLKCPTDVCHEYVETPSTGSGIVLWAVCSKDKDDIDSSNPIRLGSDALGERGKRAEDVGAEAANRLLEEMGSGAAVDRHLADNLIPLMGIICPSEIKTSTITEHSRTNAMVVEKFLKSRFALEGNTIRSAC
jgi:RNA 3'-terminal phosphate cyclase